MSRLGPDVEAAQEKGEAWSVARKAGYARQMLALLRTLHEKCKMIFVDVKPGVLWLGEEDAKRDVVFDVTGCVGEARNFSEVVQVHWFFAGGGERLQFCKDGFIRVFVSLFCTEWGERGWEFFLI